MRQSVELKVNQKSQIETYFADEVGQFSEKAFQGHVLCEDAAHLGQESTSSIDVANCAMEALSRDHNEDAFLNCISNCVHQNLIINR